METSSTISFLSVVTAVTAILQIILFFKLWIMTNDVKLIKDTIKCKEITTQAQIAYLKGNKEVAKDLILSAIYATLLDFAKESISKNDFNQYLINVNQIYKPICEKMNFEMIDLDQYKDMKNLPVDDDEIRQ